MRSAGSASFVAKFGDLTMDELRKSHVHSLVGLGYLRPEDKARARSEFDAAARLDYKLWARVMLSRLE